MKIYDEMTLSTRSKLEAEERERESGTDERVYPPLYSFARFGVCRELFLLVFLYGEQGTKQYHHPHVQVESEDCEVVEV